MIKKLYFLLFCLFFLKLFSVYTEIIIDIDKAVEMAAQNNLQIQSEVIGLRMKKRTKDTTWNYFIPSVSVSATLSKMNETIPPTVMEIPADAFFLGSPATAMAIPGGDDFWDISFGLRANLTITASMFVGMKQALLDYQAGLINIEMVRKKLDLNVKKAFYNIILLNENIKLMEQTISNVKDRYNQAKANYENGLVSEYDMLSAQVALENMKPGLEEMKIGYQLAIISFKQMIGLKTDEDIQFKGTIRGKMIEIDSDNLKKYISNKLEVKMLAKQLEMLENLKLLSIMSFTPVVTFSYSADPAFGLDPFGDNWFENMEDNWAQRAGMFAITLSIPVDGVLPSSRTQVDISNKTDSIKQTRVGLEQLLLGAELEIESIAMRLEKSMNSIDTLKLNVKLAGRAYNMANEAYKAGSIDLLALQNAELELRRSKLEVLKEEYTYVTGILDLEYALNTVFKKE